jgi:fibronectin type 3 domain-containing protein
MSVWVMMSLAGCSGSGAIPPASVLTSGEVTLTWQQVPDAAAYNVYFSTSPGVTVLNSYKIADATNPITITDLEPGTTYYFVVTVEDNSGQIRKSKEISYKVVNTVGSIQFDEALASSDPKQVPKAAPPETGTVTLAWDDVSGATSYNIYWSDQPGVTKKTGTKISNVKNPHKIAGLKKGQTYYFTVTAVNASGESKESDEFSFTVEP